MKGKWNKLIVAMTLAVTLGVFSPMPADLQAQCPMCRMSAESNLKAGGTAGRGLNTGILYMLAMPYLLVGTIGFIWWRNSLQVDGDREEWNGHGYR